MCSVGSSERLVVVGLGVIWRIVDISTSLTICARGFHGKRLGVRHDTRTAGDLGFEWASYLVHRRYNVVGVKCQLSLHIFNVLLAYQNSNQSTNHEGRPLPLQPDIDNVFYIRLHLLTRKKHQHVSWWVMGMNSQASLDCRFYIIIMWLLCIKDRDWMLTTLDVDDFGSAEANSIISFSQSNRSVQ